MDALEGRQLLKAWEGAESADELNRAPALLAAVCRGTNVSHWAAVSIAEINLHLLRLRQATFGSTLLAFAACPGCQTRLTIRFEIPQLLARLESLNQQPMTSMRMVTTEDLIVIRNECDPLRAREALLARCRSQQTAKGDDSVDALTETFNRINQGVEIVCESQCVECGQSQRFELDIGRFLWMEVRHRAKSLLREVHDLASAYGWSEKSILGMSNGRRRAYLDMVQA